MRIVFMGTPDFATACLERLYADGREVAAVFTQPDKPVNRGMKLTPPPVKVIAEEHGTPVYQPEKLKDGNAAGLLRQIAPELIVVVAYGRILPKEILDIPKYGCINIHGSLLPKYRGAAPIQWAVLNGDKVTGVTSMYLAEGMDEGDMIDTIETPIDEDETSGELFDRLKMLGAELLSRTVNSIENGTAKRVPQDHSKATYTTMLTKDMAHIDWTKSPREIKSHIMGMQPWPGAVTKLSGKKLKIFKVAYAERSTDKPDGTVVQADKNGLFVACGGGQVLEILELQTEGKKRCAAVDFLRGNKIEVE